jgi:Rad3-related DNA helicase
MEKKKGFKLAPTAASKPGSPELLFNDLKGRSKQIQHIWAHQADLLRSYMKEHKREDIALELPTGAGKTLVGFLIGEWRRLFYGDRVLYLCPTRQLAFQAAARAKEYGIKAGVLVGKKSEYDPATLAAYQASKAVIVSTYSSVFNIAPGLTDAQVIMLDDAHAAENYVAKMWSIPISRSDHSNLYQALLTVLAGALPNYMPPILGNDDATPHQKQSVEMISGVEFNDRHDELENLIQGYCEKLSTQQQSVGSDPVFWAWKAVHGHLDACHIFVSWDEILIRPWIAPTISNDAFSGADQRIYMSATLGDGGDLERSLGITNIYRIPVPSGWDQQGSGRRLILFPNRSLQEKQADNAIVELIRSNDRAIVMAPSSKLMKKFESLANTSKLPHKILHSQDIEDSLDVFTASKKAILCVAGRYDGIDLPDDSCRIAVLYGLPSTVSLRRFSVVEVKAVEGP